MNRAQLLGETRKMRFKEAYEGWQSERLSQEEAALMLGMSDCNFRRYVVRYEAQGLQGLIDRRIVLASRRRAPVDEVMRIVDLYRSRYQGWNVAHFYDWYRRDHQGTRSYTWVKSGLQQAVVVQRAKARGKHRRKRERRALPGMLIHQDGSRHQWLPGVWWDLIVTMDDATGEHTHMYFVAEEGMVSSLHGIGYTIARKGMFCSFYTDRGSHYFHTPEAGGEVDKDRLTQVGRARGGQRQLCEFWRMNLQIPSDSIRHHCVKTKVRVHRYVDGTLAVFHGQRKLASYDEHGKDLNECLQDLKKAA
ncbi:MAG: helix-turn-helix domain-containing protein [Betaproteobacteria bacterium]|nr:helix-turn-helix domain-containing protein [Betaproteobacteria bacterium]